MWDFNKHIFDDTYWLYFRHRIQAEVSTASATNDLLKASGKEKEVMTLIESVSISILNSTEKKSKFGIEYSNGTELLQVILL